MAQRKGGDKPRKRDVASHSKAGGTPASIQEGVQQWSQLVAAAWTDEKLKKRLIAKPADVLREYGIAMPSGVEVRIFEDTAAVCHLVLPPKPAGAVTELTSEQLDGVAGGWACNVCGSCAICRTADVAPFACFCTSQFTLYRT